MYDETIKMIADRIASCEHHAVQFPDAAKAKKAEADAYRETRDAILTSPKKTA